MKSSKKVKTKSKKENTYNFINLMYFISLLLFILLGSILIAAGIIDIFIYAKTLIIFGIIGLIIYITYKFIFSRELNIQDLLVILMAFCDYLSYYFSEYRRIAIWGFVGRREGLLILYTYYIIFLLATTISNKKYLKYLLYIFIAYCIVNVFCGTLQMFNITSILGISIKKTSMYATAFIGNSNSLSALMIIFNGLCLGYYLFNDNFNNRPFYISLILLITSIIGIVISGSMSGIVGVVAMNILILFLYFNKKNHITHAKKKYVIYLILMISCSFLISKISNNEYIKDITDLSQKVVSVDDKNNNVDNGRLHIWKEALTCYPKHIWTGVGIDAFYYLCGYSNQIIDPTTNRVVDKAHNEYLQYLTTEGIFKFIMYIIFIAYIFFSLFTKILKNKKEINYYQIALLIAFFGYITQAFFNISVTRVSPIFYLLMGIMIIYVSDKVKVKTNEQN